MNPRGAAWEAGQAAENSIAAAEIAQKERKKAVAAAKRTEKLAPDPHREMLAAIAAQEQSAVLRIGPRRNRWRDLVEYEEQLVAIEQRRAALHEEITALNLRVNEEPARHTAALASWMEEGEKGERPTTRLAELEAARVERKSEYDALGVQYERTLRKRAEHVVRNRDRFVRDVQKAIAKKAEEQRKRIDELEQDRQELLDLRETQVWAALFPSELVTSSPPTGTIVGANKRAQEQHLPGVTWGLEAARIFALLREDIDFCASVSTLEQAAAMQGKTTAALTGREAQWQHGDKPDYIGPSFDATWRGSPEEAVQAKRVKSYTEQLGKRLRGER